MLTFTTHGSVGTHLIRVGRLSKGAPKKIQIELKNQLEAVGSLHVLSEDLEVRSTEHREAYKVESCLADLAKNGPALSAAELLKLEPAHYYRLSADRKKLALLREEESTTRV